MYSVPAILVCIALFIMVYSFEKYMLNEFDKVKKKLKNVEENEKQ